VPKVCGVFKRDGYRCVACGATEYLTIDHIIPRSRGGSDSQANKQTLCETCNKAKADSLPESGGERRGERPTPKLSKKKRRRRPPPSIPVSQLSPRLQAVLSVRADRVGGNRPDRSGEV
jgi:hypothetical protein